MSNALLEQYVKAQVALTQFAFDLRERMREQRGQTTVEWLVIMVGLIALAGVLAQQNVWQNVGKSIAGAFSGLIDKVGGKST
jgi:Flp pilus assembly pilin Flp